MKTRENQNIEWKKDWKDEYLKWICGFANADGCILEIGRANSGEVVGLDNAQKLLEDIPNKVRDILGIIVDVNLFSENDFNYLRIVVEPYPYPISYKGQYHYRTGATKQELKGAALDKFLLKKQGLHWDALPIQRAKVDELGSLDTFKSLATKSQRMDEAILLEEDEQILEKLRMFDEDSLKRATVLLFHPDPEKYITGAFVKIAFWESESEILYQDEVHGNLFEQAEKTIDILTSKYLKAEISYDGLVRIDKLPIPKKALREAVLNAIVHKDYSSGTPIQISVYKDKVMIWNNGELFQGWTVNNLYSKHASQPYNPDVANVFFRAGLIEAWGRGIEKMQNACKEHGSPEPELKYETGGLWTIFPFKQEVSEKTTQTGNECEPIGGQIGGQTGGQIGGQIDLTNRQLEILDIIREDPKVNRKTIAEKLSINESAIQKHLKSLKDKGFLKRIGGTRGYWEVIENGN
jgi:ATP-dependent DNA helicase RecG